MCAEASEPVPRAPRPILITGATGFLGARLVWELCRRGHELWLMHRGEPPPVRAHLAALQGLFGGAIDAEMPPPQWVPGNLWLPLAGVSSEWIARHAGKIGAIVHLAADTRLRPVRQADQARTNIGGAEAVADLAEALGVTDLHHVSTAAIAGNTVGEFTEEDLDRGQTFRTHCEWTKFEAEVLLRRRADEGRLRLTVHRPATLVGDSETGGAATFQHFYLLLAAWRRFSEQTRPGVRMVLPLNGEATIPLMPVNHVAEGIAAALTDPEAPGQVFHWTPHRPLTLDGLDRALAQLLGTEPVAFDPDAPWPAPPECGAAQPVWDWLRTHRAYLMGGLRFNRAHADALCARCGLSVPEVDGEVLARLHRHWAWATGRNARTHE